MDSDVYPQTYPQKRRFLEMPFVRNEYEQECNAPFEVI
jgi:hypothetical protein